MRSTILSFAFSRRLVATTLAVALAVGILMVADRASFAQTAGAPPTFVKQWGGQGSGNGQFFRPYGMDTDSSGNVYVADTQNNRVQKFDSNGTFIKTWGGQGSGNGQFFLPYDVTTDSSNNVYVTEYGSRIQKFDSNGTFIRQLGSYGTGDGQFVYPQGIAVDSSNNIYVADTGNNRIQKLDPNGTLLIKWGGSAGSGQGQFNLPTGIDTDPSSNVYVADTQNNRVMKFDSSGNFIRQRGGPGTGDELFGPNGPTGIATDSSGNVYVSDNGNNRIQKFDSSGTFLTKWGSLGNGDGQFDRPNGVATDSSGNVYVSEFGNNRIQKFGRAVSNPDAFTYPMDLAKRTNFIGYNKPGTPTGKHPCYGVSYSQTWHAGEDWFTSVSTPIKAVAAGVVRYSSKDPGTTRTYPGGVVIVEHKLSNGSLIWSMYGHLDPNKILVSAGNRVTKGQKIANGLYYQPNNTHLHWEMRFFFDGTEIKSKASGYTMTCANQPGPGYTYPGRPGSFAANAGAGPIYYWTNPSTFVEKN